MIKLKITREVENAMYDEEYANKPRDIYRDRYDDEIKRQRTVVGDILEVEITDEQFNAIRREVLKEF
jgi:hypothetical protein